MTAPPDPTRDRDIDAAIERLLAALPRTGPLVTEAVTIPGTPIAIEVTRPTDTDALLDLVANDPEQNLPYWSEIWPSGVALASDIARRPERLRGRRVIELGSGLGITAAVAIAHGAELTATDYAEESLALTRITCLRSTGKEPETRRVNWRSPEMASIADAARFDVVLAADALYERRDIEPLVEAVEALVTPGGALWLAEPGRTPARMFLEAMAARGWNGTVRRWNGPWPDPEDAGIVVRTHWLRRGP